MVRISLRKALSLCGVLCAILSLWAAPARSQSILDLPYMDGFTMPLETPVDPQAAQVAHLVHRAGLLADESGQTLLPFGTWFDRLDWVDDIAHVYLTIPVEAGVDWLTPIEVEYLGEVLKSILIADPPAAGALVMARLGEQGEYKRLTDYLSAEQTKSVQEAAAQEPIAQPTAIAGPVSNGGTQPSGALSGVVVYTTAGHGWTYTGTSWGLQRGLTEGMVEDYGNIDQLNYFVAYLFNAGATVVPFRPVGYQRTQIVLDNDDPGVTYTGSWANALTGSSTKYYENQVTVSGVAYRIATAAVSESAVARYTPTIPTTDFYPVYGFTPEVSNPVRTTYRICHSGGTSSVVVDHRLVSKGWIWLGNYYFLAGTSGYVEISNASPDGGNVAADAIRFGNGVGDVSRGSAGTSQYPREEEAMRYWAHSELGNNAVGFGTSVWETTSDDSGDNVGTGARWGAEMNRTVFNNDRWRRVYLEFHTNSTPAARGMVTLITDWGPTTYQSQYAHTLADSFEADMAALNGQFEFNWWLRGIYNTYTSTYGAISTNNNGNEFDATIIEVAFHDNPTDAKLLRDSKVRNATARASLKGMIKFLRNNIPGSTIPLAFLPESPERVQVVTNTNGTVTVSWTAPPSGGANGDPATGYKIYRSTNGYGFDAGLNVGNVTAYVLGDIPAAQTTYIRVAAYNAGGESMPSETLAVRRPASGRSDHLIVNGFDRLTRFQNITQSAYVGTFERQILRRTNAYDYAVQHAQAMAANNATFDTCSRRSVNDGTVNLAAYQAIIWIMGEQSSDATRTFNSTEQSLLGSYLVGGGRMFVSGADITYDLINQGGGATFCQTYLKANYVANDANTYTATGSGGILAGIGSLSFSAPAFEPKFYAYNTANGAYDVDAPDQISALSGAQAILTYSGGTGGTAAVQHDAGTFRTVTFAFPFEMINSSSMRTTVMGLIINYLQAAPTIRADFDLDDDVDLEDYARLQACFNGDGPIPDGCSQQDMNFDNKVNQDDRAGFMPCLNGPEVPPGC
ncbi:MAG TPA: fibronectin type III domain-containing protein [Phycisphaerae bacterium]|nr:fibronectin type III domain-containing protein [Phycisphaerae bacterium]